MLERAWAYYYVDRYGLDLSSSGVVHGASYTDVHVRLAALTLLAVVSLVAFVAFSVNIYERSLALPAIAFGLWVFLALVVGVIYPAIFQALRVTPAQSTLELPYIKDNIAATRYAMGIDNVDRHTFPANEDLTPAVLTQYQKTLSDVLLWDPSVAVPTFQRLQVIKSYYQLSTLAVDRYEIDGKTTPVVVGVRSLNPGGLAQQSWVNTHLQYTHGYGVVAAAANVANSSNLPNFLAGNIPTSSSSPALSLSRPAVYYAPGDSQYVDRRHQAARGPVPGGERNERRGPLPRLRRDPDRRLLQPTHLCDPPEGPEPSHFQPRHGAIAAHLHSRHRGTRPEGAAISPGRFAPVSRRRRR